MNQSMRVIFAAAIILSSFMAQAMPCDLKMREGSSRPNSPRARAETLRDAFRRVADGSAEGSTITPTPQNELVSFYQSSATGSSLVEGRIETVRRNASGTLEVVILERLRNHNEPVRDTYSRQVIPLSQVQWQNLSVTKILTPAEIDSVRTRIKRALETNQMIRFRDVQGSYEQIGRVVRIKLDQDGKENSFVLSSSHSDVHQSFSRIDPDELVIFTPRLRAMNSSERDLFAELSNAKDKKIYVSFEYNGDSDVRKFEGWISAIEINQNGEPNLILDTAYEGRRRGDFRIQMANVVPGTFVENPRLSQERSGARVVDASAAVRLSVFTSRADRSQTRQISPPAQLMEQLSVFADGDLVSGQKLPPELAQLLTPGNEVRLYFASSESQIRLTIRRDINGAYLIGSTEWDLRFVDESYQRDHDWGFSQSSDDRRYSLNEWGQMEQSRGEIPASTIRHYMAQIRARFIKEYVNANHADLIEQLKQAFPEDYRNVSLAEWLLFYSRGWNFSLSQGIISVPVVLPSPSQMKFITAVKYVLNNNKVFYSRNAGASGIALGIYDRGSLAEPERYWLTGYDFAHSLFSAMEKLGLRYDETEMAWVPK